MLRTKFSGYGADGRRLLPKGGDGGSTTSVTQNYSPEEAAQRALVQGEAARLYGSTKDSIANSKFPGAAPVPFDRATVQAQDMALGNASAAQSTLGEINKGVKFGLNDAMDVQRNPYLQSAIQAAIRPITQSYTDPGGVMAQIRQEGGAAQPGGGSRQGIAEGVAAGRYAQTVGDTAAKIASAGYDTGQNTFARTLAFAPQAMESAQLPVNWVSAVGAQRENMAQLNSNYAADQTAWQMNAPWSALQNYANIVMGTASPGTTSTTSGGGVQRNPLMGALGGASMGAGLATALPALGIAAPWAAAGGALLGLL